MIKKLFFLICIFTVLFLQSCDMETTAEEYTITFDSDGGTPVESIVIKKGEKVNFPYPPMKEGCMFMGWFVKGTDIDFLSYTITSDTTFIAKWESPTFTITYHLDGGINHPDNVDTFMIDKEVILYEPTKEGYYFEGFYYNDRKISSIGHGIYENVDLYAKWRPDAAHLELLSEPIEVSMWHVFPSKQRAILLKIIDNFEREYKELGYNIKVVDYYLGDYLSLRKRILIDMVADELPTIIFGYQDDIALYTGENALVDLDYYIQKTKYGLDDNELNQYVQGFFEEGRTYNKEEALYSLPYNKTTEVLYYNKTIFEKYGWSVPNTWDEVIEICEKWKMTEEYNHIKLNNSDKMYGLSIDSESNLFYTLSHQFGANITSFDENGNGVISALGESSADTSKSKEAMEWLKNQYQKGNIAASNKFNTNYASDAFKGGQCIMTIGSITGASYNVPEDKSFEVGVTTYPQKAGSDRKYVINQGMNISLCKCEDYQEELAGWLFLKYLSNYESSLTMVTGFDSYTNLAGVEMEGANGLAFLPIRKDVIASYQYQECLDNGKIGNLSPINNVVLKTCLLQLDWLYNDAAISVSSIVRDQSQLLAQAILYDNDCIIDELYDVAYNKVKEYKK